VIFCEIRVHGMRIGPLRSFLTQQSPFFSDVYLSAAYYSAVLRYGARLPRALRGQPGGPSASASLHTAGSFPSRGPGICREPGVIMGRCCVKAMIMGRGYAKWRPRAPGGRPQVAKHGCRAGRPGLFLTSGGTALGSSPLSARRFSLSSASSARARGTELAPVRCLRHPESLFSDRTAPCPAAGEQCRRPPPPRKPPVYRKSPLVTAIWVSAANEFSESRFRAGSSGSGGTHEANRNPRQRRVRTQAELLSGTADVRVESMDTVVRQLR
jgi:hypothetical protein